MTHDDHRRRRPLDRWRAQRRQRREHAEFRIAEPPWDESEQRRLRTLADQLTAALAEASNDTTPNDTTPNDTTPNDTTPNDTTPNDTTPNDTAVKDTAVTSGADDGAVGVTPAGGAEIADSSLAAAATNLWRARKKLARAGDDQTREQRQIARYLRSSAEALQASGVLIQDHDGTVFDSRLSLEALAFQEDPAVSVETVMDTVRPSIYVDRRRIQMGQVVVATPPAGAAESSEKENHARHD